MLRVLIITTVKIGYDGLTNHIFSYIKNMDKSDIQIDLISARGTDEKIIPQLNQVGFHKIYHLEYRDARQIQYLKDLTKLIKRNHYDIVHAHGNSATLAIDMLAGKLAGCKIRIAHSHNTSCEHKLFHFILRPVFQACYTDGFACSQEAGEWLFRKNPFMVISNGKEIDEYRFDMAVRNEYRHKLGILEETIALGNVAAFVGKKNHIFSISVFRDLNEISPNYEMFLFGLAGETLEDIKERIKTLGLEDKIHYMGTKDNIQDYMQAMDIMMLPSLYEGFPVTAIEWQINGLPCILADTITRKCNICGDVKFLPVNQGTKPWVEAILHTDYSVERRTIPNIEALFTKAGFNIKINAAELKKMYFDIVAKRNKANAKG